MCARLAKTIGLIYKVRNRFPLEILTKLYHSLVYPQFLYAIEAYYGTIMQNINKLCVIQKRAIRTIHKLGYTEHTDPFFKSNNILPLENLHVFQVCIYIFKSVANVGSFNIFHKLHTFSSA